MFPVFQDAMAAVKNSHGEENSSASCVVTGEDFAPSKLGTKQYWDDAYSREIQTFRDIGDVGEIWFGEESMNRVIRWMEKLQIPEDAAILDIGTGNGVFLVELAKQGFKNLTGIDYSSASVELALNVLVDEGFTNVMIKAEGKGDVPPKQYMGHPQAEGVSNIRRPHDVVMEEWKSIPVATCEALVNSMPRRVKAALENNDKGTFDAMSLNPEGRDVVKLQYVTSLSALLKPQGHFVITSCNWTKEQLLQIFSPGFELLQELPTPRFQFGGVIGNSVTALVFRRIN